MSKYVYFTIDWLIISAILAIVTSLVFDANINLLCVSLIVGLVIQIHRMVNHGGINKWYIINRTQELIDKELTPNLAYFATVASIILEALLIAVVMFKFFGYGLMWTFVIALVVLWIVRKIW